MKSIVVYGYYLHNGEIEKCIALKEKTYYSTFYRTIRGSMSYARKHGISTGKKYAALESLIEDDLEIYKGLNIELVDPYEIK